MKSLPIYTLFILLLMSCTSSKKLAQETDITTATEIHSNFEINSTWANPIGNSAMNAAGVQGAFGPETSSSRINIAGNTNHIRKIGDRFEIYLPYYGTRTTGATPLMNSPNGSIRFEGIPDSYTVIQHASKDQTQMLFEITEGTGHHSFLIKLYNNNKVTIDVNATHRSRIQYEGVLVLLDE